MDESEIGMPGMKVTIERYFSIFPAESKSQLTDENGFYEFSDLKMGLYRILVSSDQDVEFTGRNSIIKWIGFFSRTHTLNIGISATEDENFEISLAITADPDTIEKGESALLSWHSLNTKSLQIDQGIGSVEDNSTITVSPAETTLYTITAEGISGNIKKASVTITVLDSNIAPPPLSSSTTTAVVSTTTTASSGGGGGGGGSSSSSGEGPSTTTTSLKECDKDTDCTDNNTCTGKETCINSECIAGIMLNCDDGNPCTHDTCDPTGGCLHDNNTLTCNDNNVCTANELCVKGSCQPGTSITCDDGDKCTIDTCDPDTGCIFTLIPDCECVEDSDCTDNNVCTGAESCVDNQCLPGTPLTCDDGNPCTDDSCDPTGGCHHANNTSACDDSSACTSGDLCSDGSCQPGTPITCDDGDGCTNDTCDPGAGCVFTQISGCQCDSDSDCSDSNVCTGAETCSGMLCVAGTPPDCDDGNPCTDDSCVPASGCASVAVPGCVSCSFDSDCAAGETCIANICQGSDLPPDPPEVIGITDGSVYTNNEMVRNDNFVQAFFTPVPGTTCSATLQKDSELPAVYTSGTKIIGAGSYQLVVTAEDTGTGLTADKIVNFVMNPSDQGSTFITNNNIFDTKLEITYNYNTYYTIRAGKPLFAVWAEDANGNFLHNLYVSTVPATNIMRYSQNWAARPQALPYWAHKACEPYGADSIYIATPDIPPDLDAVTGATNMAGFKVITNVNTDTNRIIRILFEINQSFDTGWYFNDAFSTDKYYKGTGSYEPALVYGTLIDLDNLQPEYSLDLIGYSHFAGSDGNLYTDYYAIDPDTELSRYIFDHATSMVGSITVTVN